MAWAEAEGSALLIEVKTHPWFDLGAARAIASVLAQGDADRLVVYSSDHALVAELAELLPAVPRGVIVNEHCGFIAESLRATGASLLSQSSFSLTPDTVAQAHELDCLVAAELRYPEDVTRLVGFGVDVLVTQRVGVVEAGEAIAALDNQEAVHG